MRYTDENRGTVQNPDGFRQNILFDGIRRGRCTPTDIDAVMEFGGEVLILYEVKYGSAPVPTGQALLLKRLVDAWAKDGKEAALFVCRHNTKAPEDIHLKNTLVTSVYYKGKMHEEKIVRTAEQRTNEFLDYCGRKNGGTYGTGNYGALGADTIREQPERQRRRG